MRVGAGREKIQRCYDFFLVFLALLCVVLLILQDRMDLSDAQDELIEWLDLGIWIAFAADYCVNLYLAADRRTYVRTHIVELVAILPFNAFFKGIRLMRIYPLIRSTRLLQASRLFRLVVYFGRTHKYVSRFLRRHNFHYVLFFTVSTVLLGAVAIGHFEKMDLNDAIWWAFVTATTVGYGDISPASPGGRIVAVVLMLVGIGFISTLTGTIASYFVRPEDADAPAAAPRNEFVAAAIRRLEDFDALTPGEVREICAVLVSLKDAAEIELRYNETERCGEGGEAHGSGVAGG